MILFWFGLFLKARAEKFRCFFGGDFKALKGHLEINWHLQDDTDLEHGLSSENEHVQTCPICQKAVHKDLMNTHLDFCEAPEAVAT